MDLAGLSIRRPIFISCLVALMLIMGYTSLKKMPVDLFPDVTFPVIFVNVVYPGASPVDMEKLVAKPIEDELSSLSGLRTITSNNLESVSVVIMEFRLGTDIKEAEQQIRNRIGNIRNKLPADIREPIIRRFDPADQPVITIAVKSKIDAGQLYDLSTETIKPFFERLNNVGLVSLIGGRKTQVDILVDKNKLQDRQISMLQVSRRIEETSKDIPIGKIENTKSETVLRTQGEFNDLKQIEDVSVNFIGSDRAVRLKEIAEVKIGLEDQKRIARIQGEPVLILEIFKQSGSNTVAVTDAVKKEIEKVNTYLKAKNVDATVEVVRDLSRPIRLNIEDVRESIVIGIILCIIVVFFFLGSARSTFITGMALPNSLLGGFVIMYVMGFSINIMTLLALSLAVGLLIDDAIVVRENIFRHLEMGKSPKDAALEGTKEVAQAVIATTLVVIAVFGPIAFVDGIVGQFFKQFGLTIVFTMLISLFDAFTVAPMLSAYMATKNEHHRGDGFVDRILKSFDQMQNWLEDKYESTIRWTLAKPKTVIVAAVVFFFGSVFLGKFISKTFLPAGENGEFNVTIEMPVGTSLQGTSEFTKEVEQVIVANQSIELALTTVGSQNDEANKAQIYVRLLPRKQRQFTTLKVKMQVRDALAELAKKNKIEIGDIDIANSGQKPFNINLVGENLESLSDYANKLTARISQIPGLTDVDTNFRSGKPEFHVQFDRNKSESLGVSTVTAGAELRNRTEGSEAAVYRKDGIEYKVKLRLDEKYRDLREQFQTTFVPNQNFNMIPLSRIAHGQETSGYSQINRRNKSRFINIGGNLGPQGNLGDISVAVEKILKTELLPPPGVEYRFQGQAEDFKDLMENMMIAIFLGVIFIYLVLASLYESFVTPFTILLALPLAITGAFIALLMFGKTIDIFSLIGLVLLLGVVAKNSILLVDYMNQLISEGMARQEAVIKACRTRLRPILMTSFALIAGMIPIAIGLNEASAMRTSMGVAIIGGLISSTALTLIVVPAAYGYIEDFRVWMGTRLKRLSGYQG